MDNLSAIQKMIDHYLLTIPKPHIIALSILCQGYLAAHGKKDSLRGWEDVCNNLPHNLKGENFQLKTKSKTEEKDWWEPALEADFNGEKLVKELKTMDKDKKAIECLIKIIKNKKDENSKLYFDDKGKIVNGGMTQKFTGKVTEAYENLTKILGNC